MWYIFLRYELFCLVVTLVVVVDVMLFFLMTLLLLVLRVSTALYVESSVSITQNIKFLNVEAEMCQFICVFINGRGEG